MALTVADDGRRFNALVLLGLAGMLGLVAIARLTLLGWAGVAPDDARYVFVGLSTLGGHGPLTPSGNVFLLRSPVYGIALAVGSVIGGGDPVGGARIVAVALTLAGFAAAVRLGWRIGGTAAAVLTAGALLAMPLLWRLLPTLRIDLPQAAGVIAVLLAIQRPTIRRWALAGAFFGLTILVKETILLLGLLPLAFVGTVEWRRLSRLWTVFLAVAAIVAGWWWVVVWTQSGTIFPLNAVGVIERRDVAADVHLDGFGAGLLAVVTAAWLVLVVAARREPRLRLLIVAALCLVPPAAYATLNGLSTRNYAGLAVLSAVAIGAAGALLLPWLVERVGRGWTARAGRFAAVAVVALVAGGAAIAGQARVGNPGEPALPGQIVSWLRSDAPSGSRAVMTFRYNEIVALELYGDVGVPGLAAVRVDPAADLADFVWIGLRDRQLFGYTRSGWEQTLRASGVTHLVIAGPHPLSPSELMPALDGGGVPGLTKGVSFESGDEWATIYRVVPTDVRAGPADVAIHLSAPAALAWLDLADGGSAAAGTATAERLLAGSGAVIVGPDQGALRQRMEGAGCLVALPDQGAETSVIVPVGPMCGEQAAP